MKKRHNKVTKFFVRKGKILARLRKLKGLESEISDMRMAQRKLAEDYPEIAEWITVKDFV